MPAPAEKLAQSLAVLKALQDQEGVAIPSRAISRTHRQRLLGQGFLQAVIKGWYIPSRPDGASGESTAWYASFWAFCSAYLDHRFGKGWCLTAEQSLLLHAGNWTVPRQLFVRAPKGGNRPMQLPHDTSLFDIRLALPAPADIAVLEGVRVMGLEAALVSCGPTQFRAFPVDTRAALAMVTDASGLLARLLEGGQSVVAGRLAGAFRNIGRPQIADVIVETMRTAGYVIHETDPFADRLPAFRARDISPAVNRLRMNWERMREEVLKRFPKSPGLPRDVPAYLHQVEDTYATDAYHSLSIEGYRVNAALIERVQSGDWNPGSGQDREYQDALAARGYWQAFQRVKASVQRVLVQENPGDVAEQDHGRWYRDLFAPSVAAGILKPADLAGYRSGPVHIRHSKHAPPRSEAVRDLMPAYFDLLREEHEPSVRVVLGHFMFVYIHPYFDGNGRMGRFLMNAMLASGGYAWTVIPVEQRDRYMAALEAASVEHDIVPFTAFLAELVAQASSPPQSR
jgi:hypothetical protein